MKVGDLVEIYSGVNLTPAGVPPMRETGIYLEMDYNSPWSLGEVENYSRAMVLWDDTITSIPVSQIEVIHGN